MSLSKKQKINSNETKEEVISLWRDSFEETRKLLAIENELCSKLERMEFKAPVEYIYNPLKYAKDLHETFIKKFFENSTKKIMFLAMNPGPWGMCQTGIVFGESNYVKEWLKISGIVQKPDKEHPKRKITGLNCHRSEVSGKKFWQFFQNLCGTPENFFKHSFVYNLCPLAFMEVSGKNITPPEIKDYNVRKTLYEICNEAFIRIIKEFDFEVVVGIGKFAEKSAIQALKLSGISNIRVCSIPHPSPRNAKNFSNWNQTAYLKLHESGLMKYFNEGQVVNSEYFKTSSAK